jgi:hypothetical protein
LFIYLFGITSKKACSDFWRVNLIFVVDGLILLFVDLVELLGLVYTFFSIYGSLVVCA